MASRPAPPINLSPNDLFSPKFDWPIAIVSVSHGLRHSLGATLFDLGLDRDARKAALGHRSDAANSVYERGGNRRAAADRAFAAYDDHLASIHSSKNAKLT